LLPKNSNFKTLGMKEKAVQRIERMGTWRARTTKTVNTKCKM